MSIYVPGYGPAGSKLAIVGAFPSESDERMGRPFTGTTGKMIDSYLSNAGLRPDSTYRTNVVKIRPPGNDISKLGVLGKSVDEYLPQLWEELSAMQPNVILAIGNVALESLTGYKGIEHYRGSILQARNGMKVVSTINPGSLFQKESDGKMKAWKDGTYIQWDVNRAVYQSTFKGIHLPHRNLMVCKSAMDLQRFLRDNRNKDVVSVDIETFKTIPICIGIAFSKHEALSVPLFDVIGKIDRPYIWRTLAELLGDPRTKTIGQNFKFDQHLLLTTLDYTTNFGFDIGNFYFDTMLGFRTIYPELPGKLEFIASVLTEEPYWKEEGKGFNPKKDSIDRLLLYNAKDSAVTFECYEKELEEMKELGIDDFYFNYQHPLHDFYRRLESRGICRDKKATEVLRSKYEEKRKVLEVSLQQEIDSYGLDCQVSGKKGNKLYNTPQRVANLLFGALELPKRKDTGDDTLSALARNLKESGPNKQKKKVIELILELRKVGKTIGTYINAKSFPDGKLRTGYRIMLETGRTSTSVLKSPVTTEKLGMAFQTITKHGNVGADLRSMFVPESTKIFLEPDLSQAESRVIAILSKDTNSIKIFNYGVDIHRVTASWIFDRSVGELREFYTERSDSRCRELAKILNDKLKLVIDDEERQLGKTFRHAGEGGMEKHRASEVTGLSEWRAGKLLDKFHANAPAIQEVYYKEVEKALQDNDRVLVNPFGRRRQFFNKWGPELFKEAYRQIPQSTVSDHLKFSMLPIEKEMLEIEVLEESHDSFLAQIFYDAELITRAKEVITRHLETPIDFAKCSLPRGLLTIPCDIKIGKNWEKMEKLR